MSHRRTRPEPVWLWDRLDRFPFYLRRDTTRVLTFEESAAIFDGDARRDLGVSGREFLRRWDAGEYADDDQHGRAILRLVYSLPYVRRQDVDALDLGA